MKESHIQLILSTIFIILIITIPQMWIIIGIILAGSLIYKEVF